MVDVIYGIMEGYSEASVEIQEAASNPAAACSHGQPIVEILRRKLNWCDREETLGHSVSGRYKL